MKEPARRGHSLDVRDGELEMREAMTRQSLRLADRELRRLKGAAAPTAVEERRLHAGTLMDLKVLQLLLCRELDERLADDRETGSHPTADATRPP